MQTSKPSKFFFRDFLIVAVLAFATVHCVRSIFLVNVSYIDLAKYAAGTERMPYQGRVTMMPVLRWAERSSLVHRAADFFDKSLRGTPHFSTPPEDVTPEKMACIAIGIVVTLLAVGFIVRYGRRHFEWAWWLPASLYLIMLYVSYAARYEAQYWYPYDLMHIALFGTAAVCILSNQYLLAFCLFTVDTPLRETSIFLVPVLLGVAYVRRQRAAIGWAVAMGAVWLPTRMLISREFAMNHSEVYVHVWNIVRAIANPLHWPQIASAFGFMILPFCLGFRYLNREERFFAFGAIPGVVVTAVYGVWYESRIWDEWLLPMSVLLTVQVVRAFVWRDESKVIEDAELAGLAKTA